MFDLRSQSSVLVACVFVSLSACSNGLFQKSESGSNADGASAGDVQRKRNADTDLESVTGDIAVVAGLDSVVPNETEDDSTMLMFQEQHSLVLPSALGCDLPSDADGEVGAGTTVNAYFVHFDPVGRATKHFSASVVFPDEILCLAFSTKNLEAGDAVVGRDDVVYPEPGSASERGLEYPGQDKVSVGADRRTLSVELTTSTSSDQLRVFTLAAPK